MLKHRHVIVINAIYRSIAVNIKPYLRPELYICAELYITQVQEHVSLTTITDVVMQSYFRQP